MPNSKKEVFFVSKQYSSNGPRKDRTSTHGSDFSTKHRQKTPNYSGVSSYSWDKAWSNAGAPKSKPKPVKMSGSSSSYNLFGPVGRKK